MSLRAAEEDIAPQPHMPSEVDWEMLDKSKFFVLGAALFSGVSAGLYPMIVLKTRQQVQSAQSSCFKLSSAILRHEGFRGFYRGLGTSLMGTIPARAVYMTALEVTKSGVGSASCAFGCSDASAVAIANAAGGLSSAMAAQLIWTPVDVVSQRLMVQGSSNKKNTSPIMGNNFNSCNKYNGGIDAFRKIVSADGLRGLYRGFGVSILTYAPSNAVWWASYSLANRLIWDSVGKRNDNDNNNNNNIGVLQQHDCRRFSKTAVAVQGVSAAMASGISALVTMPLDTIKTRMQVLDGDEYRRGARRPTIAQTVRHMVREGGFGACYRGLGPRWASMSMSATTMITTYELLKRLSTKNQESA